MTSPMRTGIHSERVLVRLMPLNSRRELAPGTLPFAWYRYAAEGWVNEAAVNSTSSPPVGLNPRTDRLPVASGPRAACRRT